MASCDNDSDESSLFDREDEEEQQQKQQEQQKQHYGQNDSASVVAVAAGILPRNSPIATRRVQHHNHAATTTRHYSFAEHQEEVGYSSEDYDEEEGGGGPNRGSASSPPTEQERNLLILMLLAQVCALHDPTPRTFTVHVLELFEQGILDRHSILFLFELGLVPTIPSSRKLLTPPSTTTTTTTAATTTTTTTTEQHGNSNTNNLESKLVSAHQNYHFHRRTVEASSIRSLLEQQERQQQQQQQQQRTYHKSYSEPIHSTPEKKPASWSAKHHPLSLSRYQREFVQIRQLSSGAFGQVFQATSNMDGRDYAIKRIPFSAKGYSNDSVQQVLREVHCLAKCDHRNVVRYYTSWYEPSWMTGSGASSVVTTASEVVHPHQKLLKDINHIVSGATRGSKDDHDSFGASTGDSSRLKLSSRYGRTTSKRPRRRFSFDVSESSTRNHVDNVDYWQRQRRSSFSKDDLFPKDILDRSDRGHGDKLLRQRTTTGRRKNRGNHYRYQISLYIQMQLCHPSTLADWIRERNRSRMYPTVSDRMGGVKEIFRQIARGLSHVHKKDIIHRDLKPANIFASTDGELEFKIGDFGLSKMIRSVSSPKRKGSPPTKNGLLLLLPSSEDETELYDEMYLAPFKQLQNSNHCPDSHTAGVGTASYASPEQFESKMYDKQADIFSLGLILLELICSFQTEHERYQVFRDCRHKRVLPKEVEDEAPLVAKVILSCTDPDPAKRPSSKQLTRAALTSAEQDEQNPAHPSPIVVQKRGEAANSNGIEELRRLLGDQESRIQDLEHDCKKKDETILFLKAENARLRASQSVFTYPSRPTHNNKNDCGGASDSSSDDGI